MNPAHFRDPLSDRLPRWIMTALMLLAIAMVHCDNPATNRLILGIFVTGVAAAFLLIASHSRPFTGAISVRPTVLEQVMPEAGAR